MIPLSLLILSFLVSIALAQKPVLVPENPAARPVREFDYVYLPKKSVVSLLPGFTRRELRLKAKEAAKLMNLPLPTDPRAQVALIRAADKAKLESLDPRRQEMSEMHARLRLLNQELNMLVTERQRYQTDLQKLTVKNQACLGADTSHMDTNTRLTCLAVTEEIDSLQKIIKSLNQKERLILREVFRLRKRLQKPL